MSARDIVLFAALMCFGLVAGLMYGWVVSVIPGHRRLDDRSYLQSMQHINRAIVNPGFLIAFLGAAVLGAVATYLQYRTGASRRWVWLAAATSVYVIGMLGVTVVGNIPLNNVVEGLSLDELDDRSAGRQRHGYERRWNRLHNLRTTAGVVAFGLTGVAALFGDGENA